MNAPANILSNKGTAAVNYANRGWFVFPVVDGAKIPIGRGEPKGQGGFKSASNDPVLVSDWWRKWPNANIGLSLQKSGLVAVDIDAYKSDCDWQGFSSDLEIPLTLRQRSARGGIHLIFKSNAGETYPGTLCRGVDVKHEGYILLEPSKFDGQQYCFENDALPSVVPAWVTKKPKVDDKAEAPNDFERAAKFAFSEADRRIALAALCLAPNDVEDRDKWVRVGLAAKAVLGDAGREPFIDWCERWDGAHKDDLGAFWSGLRPRGDASIGSLYHELGVPKLVEAGSQQSVRKSEFFSASEFGSSLAPKRKWLVQDLIPQKTVTLLSGDGGTGKSLLALQLAVAVSTGSQWLGREVEAGGVIYLSAEDDTDELHRRLTDILTAGSMSFDRLSALTIRSLAGEDALLALDAKLALAKSDLFEELNRRAGSENPALIVLDTLADLYPANENERAKVRQFIGMLRGLAIENNCAVLLLSHPSLTGLNSGSGTSGSTAWNNSVRSRLYLSRSSESGAEIDPNARILEVKKSNYGKIGEQIGLRWNHGVFDAATSLATGFEIVEESGYTKSESVFLKLLDLYTDEGRVLSPSAGANYAPSLFAKDPESDRVTKIGFTKAMTSLLRRREIEVTEDGPASRRRKKLVKKV